VAALPPTHDQHAMDFRITDQPERTGVTALISIMGMSATSIATGAMRTSLPGSTCSRSSARSSRRSSASSGGRRSRPSEKLSSRDFPTSLAVTRVDQPLGVTRRRRERRRPRQDRARPGARPRALEVDRRPRARHLERGALAQHRASPRLSRRSSASQVRGGLRCDLQRNPAGWNHSLRVSIRPSAIQPVPSCRSQGPREYLRRYGSERVSPVL